MDNFYVTYKFYDGNKRRLAIFAVPRQATDETGDYLEVWVVTCSDKDRFSRWKANKIFQGRSKGDCIKGYFHVPLTDKDKPKWNFIKWCEANYYKEMDASFHMQAKVLVKGAYGESPVIMDDIVRVTELLPIAIGKIKEVIVEETVEELPKEVVSEV